METELKTLPRLTSVAWLVDLVAEAIEFAGKEERFEFDMTTYGRVVGDICFGCIATAALNRLTDGAYVASGLRKDFSFPNCSNGGFEEMMDSLRCGHYMPAINTVYAIPRASSVRSQWLLALRRLRLAIDELNVPTALSNTLSLHNIRAFRKFAATVREMELPTLISILREELPDSTKFATHPEPEKFALATSTVLAADHGVSSDVLTPGELGVILLSNQPGKMIVIYPGELQQAYNF